MRVRAEGLGGLEEMQAGLGVAGCGEGLPMKGREGCGAGPEGWALPWRCCSKGKSGGRLLRRSGDGIFVLIVLSFRGFFFLLKFQGLVSERRDVQEQVLEPVCVPPQTAL